MNRPFETSDRVVAAIAMSDGDRLAVRGQRVRLRGRVDDVPVAERLYAIEVEDGQRLGVAGVIIAEGARPEVEGNVRAVGRDHCNRGS